MATTIKTECLVTGSFSFGESHKIISLFSREHGLIKAVANGIRKSGSKFGSSMELFNRVELVLSLPKKSDLYSIREHNLINSKHKVRDDLEILNYLYYLSEFVNTAFYGEADCSQCYFLIENVIELIYKNKELAYEILRGFQLKSLYSAGFLPDMTVCTDCGKTLESFIYISAKTGWFVCSNCRKYKKSFVLSENNYYFIKQAITKKIEEIVSSLKQKLIKIDRKEIDQLIEVIIKSLYGKNISMEKMIN